MKINRALFAILILLSACGKGGGPSKIDDVIPTVTLVAPLQNEVCYSGAVLSDTVSTVDFEWKATGGADLYELYITNLLNSQVVKQTVNVAKYTARLKRSTPYSWRVVVKGATHDVESSGWRFYVAGPAATVYAPFPAELISPLQGESMVTTYPVTLSWKGSSVSGNIASYDLYFGTASNPPLFKSNLSSAYSNYGVDVDRGHTYYWRIVTRDSNGATSISQLFQFNNR
jgi:hypothetical protein